MNSGSFLSENFLGGDRTRGVSATLTHSPNRSMSFERRSSLVGSQDGKRPADLRSLVARRIMQMLQVHDRARKEVLATHPTPAR